MSKCKSCGAEIDWIKTKAGKNAPVDVKPVKVYVKDSVFGEWHLVDGYVPHFAVCPDADKHRKKKGEAS